MIHSLILKYNSRVLLKFQYERKEQLDCWKIFFFRFRGILHQIGRHRELWDHFRRGRQYLIPGTMATGHIRATDRHRWTRGTEFFLRSKLSWKLLTKPRFFWHSCWLPFSLLSAVSLLFTKVGATWEKGGNRTVHWQQSVRVRRRFFTKLSELICWPH